jgi:hypothetical protein
VLLLESSEDLFPAREFGRILRSLGERGLIQAVDAVLIARPPASSFEHRPDAAGSTAHRAVQRDSALEVINRYTPTRLSASESRSGTRDLSGSSRSADT